MINTQQPKKNKDPEESKRIHLSGEKDELLASTMSGIRSKQKERIVEQEARNRDQLYIDLKKFPISNDALLALDRQFCEDNKVVCFYLRDEQIRLGSTDPDNPAIRERADEMEKMYRSTAGIYKISDESLKVALDRYDAIPKIIEGVDEGIELTAESLKKQQAKIKSIRDLSEAIERAPITEVLALIVGSAIKSNASDIHIEAEADAIKIRLRVDGVLHETGKLPRSAWNAVINRIKLVAGLKLNVTNTAQDGRFTIHIDDDKIEVRASTVPTSYGESVVMRLLRFSVDALSFDKLGLKGYTYTTLKREIEKPNGMIISTGPTGSGKTTTLYSILHILNKADTKILTLEDPVEYKIKGINQTQINPKGGMDFAKGLRSLLRQDPDIIMVGEIRDLETADTSINAALTGHLMLSTLHTNSAAGAVPRFLAMGSKSFLLAPSINAIIGQRLVRRLSEECKVEDKLDQATMDRIVKELEPLKDRTDLGIDVDLSKPETWKFYTSREDAECGDFGYKGRIGVFEIITMNKELEKLILQKTVSEYEIKEAAQKNGMITMLQDGLLKALQGVTSVKEVFHHVDR